MPDGANRGGWLPKLMGGVGATLALVAFLALTLLFPQLADALFDEGGKAPLLLGILGVGSMAVGYWSFEWIASRLARRRAR
jgi:hypothetical protein